MMNDAQLSPGIRFRNRRFKSHSADEIFDFYMMEGHWLFMTPSRMAEIISDLKYEVSDRKDYVNALELIKTTPEDVKQELRRMYFFKYSNL